MTALARGTGRTAAETIISGEQSIYATWAEDYYFFARSTGAAEDLTGIDFEYQFRRCVSQVSADVTLSISNGMLSIEDDAGSVASILRVNAPSGTFAQYEGSMIADLVAIDEDGNRFHKGHGVMTFLNEPVA